MDYQILLVCMLFHISVSLCTAGECLFWYRLTQVVPDKGP